MAIHLMDFNEVNKYSFKHFFIIFYCKLYIIGAIGSSDKSDIAVDDISYVAGSSCPDGGEYFPI